MTGHGGGDGGHCGGDDPVTGIPGRPDGGIKRRPANEDTVKHHEESHPEDADAGNRLTSQPDEPRWIDLSEKRASLSDILIIVFYHMLAFTSLPQVVVWYGVYKGYRAYGLPFLAGLAVCYVALVRIPLYYSRSHRPALRKLYMPLARYARSCRVVMPARPAPAGARYVLAMHPHGRVMYSTSMFAQLHDVWGQMLPEGDLKGAAAGGFFAVPVIRHWFAFLGAVDAGKPSLKRELRQGNNIMLVVGGVREVCIPTYPDKDVIYLKNRLGFIKLAMEEKAGVIPVYLFGENQLFRSEPAFVLKFWEAVNKRINIGVPFFRGLWYLPFPFSRDLLIAIGDPMFSEDGESVKSFHARYIKAIDDLFHRYIGMTPYPKHKLIIT